MTTDGTSVSARRRLLVPVRLYRQIADALEERIAAGEFKPGDRLPTERELAAYYSVSRTCVREALLALEIAKLVTIRVGSGVYVLAPATPEALPVISSNEPSPSEILEARLMFEPVICAAAAVNAQPEDIARISACLDLMREEHRNAAVTEHGDRDFHLSLAQVCGNSIAQEFLRDVWDRMSGPLWQGLQNHIRRPILRLKWIEDHQAIFNAVWAHDRRQARIAMRRHIENVIANLEEAAFL